MSGFVSQILREKGSRKTYGNRRDNPLARVPENIYDLPKVPPRTLQQTEHHVRSQAHAEPRFPYGPSTTQSDKPSPWRVSIKSPFTKIPFMKAESHRPVPEVAEEDTLLKVGATSAIKIEKRLAHETATVEEDIAAQPWPSWDRSLGQNLEDDDLENEIDRSSTPSWRLPYSKGSSGVLQPHEVAAGAVSPASNIYGSLFAPVSTSHTKTPSSHLSNPVPGFSSKMVELATIGSGGEGDCILYKHRSTSKLFVCKALIHKHSIPTRNGVPEIVLIHDIIGSYDRVLALLAWERHPVTGTLRLWHPYHDRGDLYALLETYCFKHKVRLPEAFVWHAFIQLAEALAYIHDGYNRHHPHSLTQPPGFRSIIHRDIKPENVFLQSPSSTSGAYPSIILADFGLATTRSHSS
ncbi:MAG: hypothetical protein Q9214_005497 [Letrouitia sp. 1 TL-2023]